MKEMQSIGTKRSRWKRVLVAGVFVLGLCVVGGIIADNIVVASENVSGDTGEIQTESLLDYAIRHVHAHLQEFHSHFHGE
ncbi:MAG: hypothetical protein U0930_00765 [Pirellulales bacterium]